MKHRRGMEVIKNLVPVDLHCHIQRISSKKNELDKLTNKMNMASLTSKAVLADKEVSQKILNGPAGRSHSEEENDRVRTGAEHNHSMGSMAANAKQHYAGNIMQINYNELVEATNGWDKANILGRGGFGVVFKGKWKCTDVAIKKMHYKDGQSKEANLVQMKQSLNELRQLNSFRHDNILPVYGYSLNGDDSCLVYQLMLGGSLEQRLFFAPQKPPLSWRQRISIAQGAARGLQFLHTVSDMPLIHGDVKSANILLDPCCQARIADFGLARESSQTSKVVSQVYGTVPYLAPEFSRRKLLSTKVDTFGFGVVLFEMATGLRAYDKQRDAKLVFLYTYVRTLLLDGKSVEDVMDKRIPAMDAESKILCQELLKLGFDCTFERPDDRPEMVQVLTEVEKRLETLGGLPL